MTLTLPPDMEEQIQSEAARQGQPAEVYALALLKSVLPHSPRREQRPLYETATPEELTQAFRSWADSHAFMSAPVIPLEALRRENLYED